MMTMRHAAVAATGRFDFVISPVAPCVAYPAELASPIHDPEEPFEHIGYTVAFNMSDQPAASVNAGFTKAGLPIGLQIVGRRFDDVGVLRLAQAWEEMCPDRRPWPSVARSSRMDRLPGRVSAYPFAPADPGRRTGE